MLLLSTLVAAAPVSDVWVLAPDRRALAHPGLGFAEGEQDGWLRLHATDAGLSHLAALGVTWRAAAPPGPEVVAGYRTPDEIDDALQALAEAHPDRVQLIDVGRSTEDRPIRGVIVSDTADPIASWRILGAHHGDELPTPCLLYTSPSPRDLTTSRMPSSA